AFGTEERELLLDALDDALEGVAPLVAELRRNLAARKVPQPDELADGRRVAVGHDLDEAVNLVGVDGDTGRAPAHAVLGRVEEEVERQLLVLPVDELEERRVEAGNGDLGDLRRLVEGDLGRVELHGDDFGVPFGPGRYQQGLLRLVHALTSPRLRVRRPSARRARGRGGARAPRPPASRRQ